MKTREKEWFETWFDTRYYHLLYQDRNHEEAQRFVLKLLSHFEISKGSEVLDLGCGKGRHAHTMHAQGLIVTGLDLSKNSIDHLNKERIEGLTFEQWDMRDLYRKSAFDYVFNLFTSFGYFDGLTDNLRVLQAVKQGLRPGGKLVLDYFNASRVKAMNYPITQTLTRDNVVFKTRKQIAGQHVFKDIQVQDGEAKFEYQERVQLLELTDFKEIMNNSGLELLTYYGSYALDAYDPETSDRLILLAENGKELA